ncbi:MAG: hypothetical protein WCL32_08860 [Planctomycetota bacterium]
MDTVSTPASTDHLEGEMWHIYREFFDTAEKKRRWPIVFGTVFAPSKYI